MCLRHFIVGFSFLKVIFCILTERTNITIYLDNNELTWNQAEEFCNLRGGHLLKLDTYKKYQLVQEQIHVSNVGEQINGSMIWTGLRREEFGDYFWHDCRELSWSQWLGDQTNDTDKQLCATNIIYWEHTPCEEKHNFACESEVEECKLVSGDIVSIDHTPDAVWKIIEAPLSTCKVICLDASLDNLSCSCFEYNFIIGQCMMAFSDSTICHQSTDAASNSLTGYIRKCIFLNVETDDVDVSVALSYPTSPDYTCISRETTSLTTNVTASNVEPTSLSVRQSTTTATTNIIAEGNNNDIATTAFIPNDTTSPAVTLSTAAFSTDVTTSQAPKTDTKTASNAGIEATTSFFTSNKTTSATGNYSSTIAKSSSTTHFNTKTTTLSDTAIQEILDSLVAATKVEAKSTNSYLRTKISVADPRPSATYIGFVGCAIISVTFGIIILCDVPILLRHIAQRCHKDKTINI